MRGLAEHLRQLFNRRSFLWLVLSGTAVPGSALLARRAEAQAMESTERKEKTPVKNNAIRIDDKDNVVIAIRPLAKGEEVIVDGRIVCRAVEEIKLGRKIALVRMKVGDEVIRYGEPIVRATRDVTRGEWVHVHNTEPIP